MPMTMQYDPIHMVVPLSAPLPRLSSRGCSVPLLSDPTRRNKQLAVEPLPYRTEICA
jgi:hypothetical protein